MTRLPMIVIVERSVIERFTPAIDCTSVVSAVSRDSTSPVRVTSKNVGSMRMTRAVDVGAQVGDHALAEPGDQVEAQRGEDAEGAGGGEERDEVAVDGLGAAGGHALVDQVSQRDRQREHGAEARQQRGEREQDRAAIRLADTATAPAAA